MSKSDPNTFAYKGLPKPDDPLQINLVLEFVFGYLTVSEVKDCRLLNKNWNVAAEKVLKKRARVNFKVKKSKERRPDKFMDIFAESSLSITSFKFCSNNWQLKELQDFFTKWKDRIEVLHLDVIYVRSKDGDVVSCLDISKFGMHLRKLVVTCVSLSTNILVSLVELKEIEELSLKQCQIQFTTGSTRIKPLFVKFYNVTFLVNDGYCYDFIINECVDFHRAKTIEISGRNNVLTLDMGEIKDLDELRLIDNKAVNWVNSDAKIKHIYLKNVEVNEKINCVIKDIDLVDTEIDICNLPIDLEYLFLSTERKPRTIYTCSNIVVFPKLSALSLDFIETVGNEIEPLQYFRNCPKLVAIESIGMTFLNLQWLPTNLSRLDISNTNYLADVTVGLLRPKCNLEWLTLGCISIYAAANVIEATNPKHCAIRLREIEDPVMLGTVFCLMMHYNLQTLYIGSFDYFPNFEECFLSNYVESVSDCYVFENKSMHKCLTGVKGRPVGKKEFESKFGLPL